MQLGGAIFSRRFGAKATLTYGALLWSIFTAITPQAAELGLSVVFLCRVGMGLSEGVAFPSLFHFLANWIPVAERSRAVASFLVGVHVGTTSALLFSPMIIAAHSWQMVFYSFGCAGLIWIALWTAFARDKASCAAVKAVDDIGAPGELTNSAGDYCGVPLDSISPSTTASPSQRSSVEELPTASPPVEAAENRYLSGFLTMSEIRAIRFIVTCPQCLAICATQFLQSFCHFLILSWLPSFFHSVFSVGTTSLSFTCMPYLAMVIFSSCGGWTADWLANRGIPLTRVRKMMMAVSCSGTALCIALFSVATSVRVALACVTCALACYSLSTGGFEASYLDIASPSLAGTFKSVANTLGAFSGFLAMPYSTAVLWILNGSWRGLFATVTLFQLISLSVFVRYGTAKRLLIEECDRELVPVSTK